MEHIKNSLKGMLDSQRQQILERERERAARFPCKYLTVTYDPDYNPEKVWMVRCVWNTNEHLESLLTVHKYKREAMEQANSWAAEYTPDGTVYAYTRDGRVS